MLFLYHKANSSISSRPGWDPSPTIAGIPIYTFVRELINANLKKKIEKEKDYAYLFMTTLLSDFGSPVALDSTCLK